MGICVLRPNGDGVVALTRSSGSYNYAMVDEVTADNDSTCVYRSGPSTSDDLYGLPDPSESGTISKVRVYHCYKKETSEANGYSAPLVKIGGTTYVGAQRTATTSYVTGYADWASNPYSTAAWTWTDINNLQVGVRLTGGEYTPDKENVYTWTRCTQVYVEITYSTPYLAVVAAGLALSVCRTPGFVRATSDIIGLLTASVNRSVSIARVAGKNIGLTLWCDRFKESRRTMMAVTGLNLGAAKVFQAGRAAVTSAIAAAVVAFRARASRISTVDAIGILSAAVRMVSRRYAVVTSCGISGIARRGFSKALRRAINIIPAGGRSALLKRRFSSGCASLLAVRRGFCKSFTCLYGLLAQMNYGTVLQRSILLKAGLNLNAEYLGGYLRGAAMALAKAVNADRTAALVRTIRRSNGLVVSGGRVFDLSRAAVCGLVSAIFSARAISHWQALTLAVRKTALTLPWRELLLSIPKVRDIPGLRLRHRQ